MKKLITIDEIGVKIGSGTAETISCVGTMNLTAKSISKTKKCGAAENVVAVVQTGAGTATIELHMDLDDIMDMFGLKQGSGYGAKRGAKRPDVMITAKGTDEEDNKLLVAIPLAKVTSEEPTVIDVDNAGTEIAYTSVELSYRPDSNGYGFYAIESDDLPSSITETNWMTSFNATTMAIPVVEA